MSNILPPFFFEIVKPFIERELEEGGSLRAFVDTVNAYFEEERKLHERETAYFAQFSGEDEDRELSITWLKPVEQWDLSDVDGADELPPTTDGSATLLGYVLPEDDDENLNR